MSLIESQRPSEQQGISNAKVEEVPCSKRPVWFGTDMSATKTLPAEAFATLRNALEAGFRRFDTAYSYHVVTKKNLPADDERVVRILDDAIEKSGVDRKDLTVMYKVTPDTPLDTQLKLAGKWGTTILTLHEVPENPEKFVKEVAAAAQKNGWLLGVSNVSDVILAMLFDFKLDITHVQNRFTPYTRSQWDVLKLCRERKIHYLAYGIAGSAFGGTCDAKGGMPTELLSATLDPDLINVAGDAGSLRYLLCEWALSEDIEPIVFTATSARMKNYLIPTKVPPKFIEMLARAAFCFPRSGQRGKWSLPGKMNLILDNVPSPFLARVLTVLDEHKLATFIDGVAKSIGDQKLDYFGENLIRLCFDFQQDTTESAQWLKRFVQAIDAWNKSQNKATYESVLAFACKFPHEHVNGGPDALCKAVLKGEYHAKNEQPDATIVAFQLKPAAKLTKEQAAKLTEIACEKNELVMGSEGDEEILLYVRKDRSVSVIGKIETIVGQTTPA